MKFQALKVGSWARFAKTLVVVCVSMGMLLICQPLFSQGNQGRILGTVFDQSGGAISGAVVTVMDTQRGVSRTLTADEAGEYNAPNLIPGAYIVRAEAKGFKTAEHGGILLEVGKELRVDLTLEPGEQTEKIIVTEEAPMVETTNATLGGTLSNETINDLPMNGRNFVNLLSLRPGVQLYPGGGGSTRSANGTRSEDIGYLVDGLRGDDAYSGSSAVNSNNVPAGDTASSLPIDAIQEFNTEENPKAEFGWKPGAIVNAGLKSGSNSLHGTALAFGRDTALDARNFFNQAPATKAPIGLEQFGGSIGGAIKKDKLFYFLDYEGQRYSVGSTFLSTAPVTVGLTPANPTSSIVDACNAVGRGNVTPLSAQIAGLPAGSCVPTPTNYTPGPNESFFPTNDGSNPSGIVLGLVSHNQQDNAVAKVDYHVNDHNSLSGSYFIGRSIGIWNDAASEAGIPGSGNSPWVTDQEGHIQMGMGAWTWTPNSTWVNEFRAGDSNLNVPYFSVDHTVNPLSYGINTGTTDPRYFGFPNVIINPFSTNFSLGATDFKSTPTGSLQFLDHVSVLRGKHAFKFGGEIIYNSSTPINTSAGKGSIRFSNLENFLLGDVKNSGSLSGVLTGDPTRHLHDWQYAAFVQDDWRITPRLILNLGLRYELTTVLTDRDNQLGNFDPVLGLVQVGSGETSAFHGDHNNFSPRLGLAWDVRGNGKTVIRAGGSIMYAYPFFQQFTAVATRLGLSQVPTGATYITCPAPPFGTCSGPGGTGVPVTTKGLGNMGVLTVSVPGSAGLTTGWQNQTAACVSGGTTACGSIFPASIFALQCGDGVGTDPSPCSTEAVDPNLRTPYITTWTLSVERAITNNLSLEVAYVGTHGTKLLGFQDINQPPLGSGYSGFGSTDLLVSEVLSCNTAGNPGGFGCDPSDANPQLEQLARPFTANGKFPYLSEIARIGNLDKSNYNSLQVTLTQRTSHGLSYVVGYTYAHALDAASSGQHTNFVPPDSSNPGLLYGNSDFDLRHRFTFSTTYALPGKKSPGQLLEGWSINSIVTLQTGQPWTPQDGSNDLSGTGQVNVLDSYGQTWNFNGSPADFTSGPSAIPCWSGSGGSALAGCALSGAAPPAACMAAANTVGLQNSLNSVGCYVKGNSVLIPPAVGTIGTLGRNTFRDSGFKNWDVSVTKDTKFKERLTAEFRAEFFNVLNHPNFTDPSGPAKAGFNDPSAGGGAPGGASFGCGCNTPDQAAPNPVLGSGGARSIQLGLKLIW